MIQGKFAFSYSAQIDRFKNGGYKGYKGSPPVYVSAETLIDLRSQPERE